MQCLKLYSGPSWIDQYAISDYFLYPFHYHNVYKILLKMDQNIFVDSAIVKYCGKENIKSPRNPFIIKSIAIIIIKESDMFVNSTILKLREKGVYNNTYILFMMRHIVIVNSVVMKPHGKQNWRNIWGHSILDTWVIVYSVLKNKAKFWCTTTYQIYSWLNISGLFIIFTLSWRESI